MPTQINMYNNSIYIFLHGGSNIINNIEDDAITDGSILVNIFTTFILTTIAMINN